MNHFLKSHSIAVIALALLLVVTAPALAAEVHGSIAMISPDDHTLTLVDDNNNVLPLRFLVGGQVLINDQQRTIWELRPGDQVTVTYNFTDGENLVTAIECRRLE